MRLRSALLATALTASLAALAPTASAAPDSAPAPGSRPTAAAIPGQVCFWTGAGQMGNAWCYRPGGYAEVEPPVQRNAHSFRSDYNGTVYAISWQSWGCVYREIRPYDYSDDWEWATKLDGVDSGIPSGCQQG